MRFTFEIGRPHPSDIPLSLFNKLKEIIMSEQAEHAAKLAAILAKVEKVGGETRALIAKVSELTTALANAGTSVSPEIKALTEQVEAQLGVVDDLVQDPVPAPDPVPDPVPEQPAP